MGKDYYSILGVPKTATEDEIKKAYRKQALKWHPDRNKDKIDVAKAKFQEIGEAFEVLSDKDKRTIYDQYGEEGLKAGPPPPGGAGGAGGFPGGAGFGFPGGMGDDDYDSFGGAPGGFSFGSGGGGQRFKQRQSSAKPPAIKRILPISLEDLYKGTTKRLKVTRKLRDGASGKYVTAEKILTVNVKPGWKAGTKIRFPNEGDELPNGQQQDIEFVVEEKPHPIYTREGDSLRMTIQLTLAEALAGFSKHIKTLDGRTLGVNNSNSVVHPGQESRVRGEGMPNSKTGAKGDLIIKYDVKFPARLTDEQKEGIKKLLA
ncbi:hypothetical protein PHYBLDRAFT_130062 [Phycomyces blakesleeanus NRRL 1555(-)]|uniref:J domain-containing protein n=1 Tax=Phycomyces blakesleeanus (strain ATCC 8743b / DSM 1359 / FGSC 10004 / NBRC 33097 / NRRL 1555) TaxID=763407 RepID=A0A162Q264_PHYB8|nr:hypothetical protein PHYBLDRAFT_130062 [Phycomyces blakesleeanus NRRL 1555(-)]OAD79647.1 hypothetical protein PHYBLDRAFT_130062 [Phycomyces blakesleeanus NRRL 1555(-)]|eukprot:XP_018297687.1 hypothetical protein PHYBLDRAFT_130062 [Phycomyces blakesleeanus NRRL 1555(-)]